VTSRAFRGGASDRAGGHRDDFDPVVEGAHHGLTADVSLRIWDRVVREASDAHGVFDRYLAEQRFHEVARRVAARGGRLAPDPGKVTLLEAELYGRDPSRDPFADITPGKVTRVELEARRWERRRGSQAARDALPHRGEVEALLARMSASARDESDASLLPSDVFGIGELDREQPPLPLVSSPVPVPERERLERFFGTSFADTKVHLGEAAALAPHGARGAAFGNTIVFASDEPTMDTLVHELAHVAQNQRASGDTALAASRPWSMSWDPAETEADDAVHAFMAGRPETRLGAHPAAAVSFDRTAGTTSRFDVRARHPGGYAWTIDEARAVGVLKYGSQAWLTVRWDKATRPPNASLTVDATERFMPGLGPGSHNSGTVTLVVSASFKITVEIDRAVEQTIASTHQADLVVQHDIQTEGPVMVHATPPPGVQSVWTPVNAQGPQRLLTQYQWAPADVEIPMRSPDKVLLELPPHWIFDAHWKMHAFVQGQGGAWMMWRTSERPTDAAIGEGDPSGSFFIASQLTDAGIASRAEAIRGRAAKARLEKLNTEPDDGSILGFKFWDGREVATARELANYYFPIESMAARDPISGEPSECEVFAMIGTQSSVGPYYARTPLSHAAAAQRWRELDTAGGLQGASRGKGLFRSLQIRAAGEYWVSVDDGYFRGRQMFFANLSTFQMEVENLGPLMTSTAMFQNADGSTSYPLAVMSAEDPGGNNMGRWVKAQTFRPDPDPQFLAAVLQNGNVANNVQDLSDTEVINTGQRLVNDALVEGIDKLSAVADSTDALRGLILQMPLLSERDREEAFQFLGLESLHMVLGGIFAKRDHAVSFALGNDVGGFTLMQLQERVSAHRNEIAKFQQRVKNWEFEVVRVDGDIGEWARRLAYKQLGFGMRAQGYPHRDKTSGVFPAAMAGNRSRFQSVGEQMWANKATYLADSHLVLVVLEVTAVVAGTVVLLLAANVAGAAIAGAIFESGTFAFAATETIMSAGIFTGMEMAVHGDIDVGDPVGTAKKFGKAWAYNAATFTAFNLLGAGFGALSKLAVKGVVGAEAFEASKTAQSVVQGLRITGVGASFMALSMASFEHEHGRLPSTPEEYVDVYYSTLLNVAMLEAGAVLSRPFTEAISGWQRARSIAELSRDIDAFDAKAMAFNEKLAKYAKRGEPPPEMLEQQIALLKEQAKLVGRIRDKMRGTADEETANEWAQNELGTIGDAIATVKNAQFLQGARIQPTAQSDAYTYEPGTGALEKIRDYYGKSNVDGPDAEGVIRVRDGSRTLEFRPSRHATADKSQRPEPRDPLELLKEMVGSGKVEESRSGHYTADAASLRELHELLSGQRKGSVSSIHFDPVKGEAHFEVHAGGETIKVAAKLPPRILSAADLVVGKNQPVGTPLKSVGAAEDVLRGIVHRELGVLRKVGLEVPDGTALVDAVEFGIGKTSRGEYVIVRGEEGAVDWERLPGLEPVAHTHPSTKGNDLQKDDPTTRPENFDPKTNAPRMALIEMAEPSEAPMINREVVFPSGQDIAFMARLGSKAHRVLTSFIVRDGFVMKPEPGDSSPRLEFVIEKPVKIGDLPGGGQGGADLPVYRTTLVGEVDGNVVMRRDVWTVEDAAAGEAHLYMRPPEGIVPAKAPAARASIGSGLRPGETLESVHARFSQEVQGELAKLRQPPTIQVMSADEFVERFESERGRATFRPDGAGGVIYARPDAEGYDLRDEIAHARQHAGPMGAEIRRLDAQLEEGTWKDLSIRDRIEAFRRKLDIEIDAQQQRLQDPDSAAAGDTERIHDTLAELKRLKREVESLTDRDISEMSAGARAMPQYLETPASLFSKAKDKSGRPGRDAPTNPHVDLVVLPNEGPARSAAYNTRPNVRAVSQVGQEWTETTRVSSDHGGVASVQGAPATGATIVVRTPAGNEYSYPVEPGATVRIADGAEVLPGTELAVEPGRRYRQVRIDFIDGTHDVRDEIQRADGDGWIQRGSESTRRGGIMEDAARRQADARLKEQGVDGARHIAHQRGGGGFDDVIITFSGTAAKPIATIRIREVKDYPHRYVPLEDFSAIRSPGLQNKLRALREAVDVAVNKVRLGETLDGDFAGMSLEQLRSIRLAILEMSVEIEIVLGPTTKLGAEGAKGSSVIRDLRREIQSAAGGKDILAGKPGEYEPERIEPEYVNEAVAAEQAASTSGPLGGTPGGTPGSASGAAARRIEIAADLGMIAIVEATPHVVPLGTVAEGIPVRDKTYYVEGNDAARMIAGLRHLPDVQVHDYGSGFIVKLGDAEWYFERLSASQIQDYQTALRAVSRADRAGIAQNASEAGAELGLPPANAATVEIWAIRGIREIDGRTRDHWTTDEKRDVDEIVARRPLLEAGHVGVSFDGGKTIYGFVPDTDEPIADVMKKLKEHHAYPGKLQDDTELFRVAERLADEKQWNTRPVRADILLDPARKQEMRDEIMAIQSGAKHDLGYSFPLPKAVDGQSFQAGDGYGANQIANCAVFPSKVGLPIPEPSGNMKQYVPKLQEWANAPTPVDARSADDENTP